MAIGEYLMGVWPPPPKRPHLLRTMPVTREIYDYLSLACSGLAVLSFFGLLAIDHYRLVNMLTWVSLLLVLSIPVFAFVGLLLGIRGKDWWTGRLGIFLCSIELASLAAAIIYPIWWATQHH